MSCLCSIFDNSKHIICSWNFLSLFGVLNCRGGWVDSAVKDKNPKTNLFWLHLSRKSISVTRTVAFRVVLESQKRNSNFPLYQSFWMQILVFPTWKSTHPSYWRSATRCARGRMVERPHWDGAMWFFPPSQNTFIFRIRSQICHSQFPKGISGYRCVLSFCTWSFFK